MVREEDVPALGELMKEYIVDFYQRPEPPKKRLAELIELLREEERGVQFVAERDGKLIGFATLYFTFSTLRAQKTTVMNDLYVVESERGSGAAVALFQQCESYTKSNGYAFMTWETAQDNHRAQRFYEKMGGVKGDWLTYSI
ncbi:GNAT family N-acetyltransferase [Tumebacillus sp. ITR2]|uniref:GNAT family N-acetyltransferase n=2 Tax=Tumebacillus amylolyticus TaxID=2801339 RepID=A0ABS1J4H1_9BACL|nr:GNAT family N-acetyltransferase [Tumebacillus amylolyticus]